MSISGRQQLAYISSAQRHMGKQLAWVACQVTVLQEVSSPGQEIVWPIILHNPGFYTDYTNYVQHAHEPVQS